MQGSHAKANDVWPLEWLQNRLDNVENALNLEYHRKGKHTDLRKSLPLTSNI